MTGPVIANVFIGEGGTSSNDGTRTKVSRSKVLEANNDNDEAEDKGKDAKSPLQKSFSVRAP